MAEPERVARQAPAAARLRRRQDRSCRSRDTLDYRFKVQNNGTVVPGAATPASCPTRSRTAPRSCSRARSGPHGFAVEPNGVMAKCPSKYEASPNARRDPDTLSSRQLTSVTEQSHHASTRHASSSSPPSSSARYAVAASVAGARRRSTPLDRKRHRRLLPHRGADDGRLGGASSTPSSPTTTRSSTSQRYSDAAQPLFYKITSYWGGLDGSIMFWVVPAVDLRRRSPSTSTASATAS